MQEIDFRTDLLPLKDQLFRLALRITLDRAEAEDIVQDTLLRVWERRAELSGVVNSLEAYCLTVCRNLALDRKERKEAQNLSLESGSYDAADNTLSPQEQLEHDDRLRRIHRLFCQLPERQRSVVQLRDIEGKSYKEIATVLGLTEEVVKVTLFRARQSIRQQYEKIEAYGL
ncbi:MAG: RNA polymerase sigma factor [Alloprevotella sp.]|nr:RNA polymerase sigma factor [Alloprevotella sp.]